MSDQDHDITQRRTRERPWGRRVEVAEVAVLLLLILPPLFLSLFVAGEGEGGAGFALGAVAIMAHDLALVSLVLFFVWRSGEGVARLGWGAAHYLRELLAGIVLFVPVAAAMAALELLLHALGLRSPPTNTLPAALRPHGAGELVLATVLVVVVAFSEETIFRGYLVLRFRRLTGSTVFALVVSSAIFAVGHGYEGGIGVITVGFLGLLLALIFVWRGSLIAPMMIHFLQDFMSIVLVQLVSKRG